MNKTKQLRWLAVSLAAGLAVLAVVAIAQARGGGDSFGSVRAATARFHNTSAAKAEGWDLRPGLDNCFDSPAGGMGFHYINLDALNDLAEDPLRPEALVYAPASGWEQQLAAVEYIVPAGPWDAAGNTTPPELFGRHFHLDPALGVYVLHAWIFKDNPSGTFEDFNPRVPACPAS